MCDVLAARGKTPIEKIFPVLGISISSRLSNGQMIIETTVH